VCCVRRTQRDGSGKKLLLYYESTKEELKTRPINECRYDERLKTKVEESTRLTYTGLSDRHPIKVKINS
jgi:hypothetical protein